MRKVKGDGNCFYRAYMFAIYESVLAKPDEAKAILQQFKAFYEKMIAPDGLGYQADAIEMFYEDAVKYSSSRRPAPPLHAAHAARAAALEAICFVAVPTHKSGLLRADRSS